MAVVAHALVTAMAWLSLVGLAGCSTGPTAGRPAPPLVLAPAPTGLRPGSSPSSAARPGRGVVRAGHTTAEPPADKAGEELPPPRPAAEGAAGPKPAPPRPGPGLPDLIKLTVERNPRLAQVGWAVETARGRAVQAGLYPNPTLTVSGDELGDRFGPGGIWTAPYFQQEVVTAGKLGLSRAAALKEVDQAALRVVAERYRLFTDVRQNYYEVLTPRQRAEILGELVRLAEESVTTVEKPQNAAEAARLDVVQLEVDRGRYRADLEATQRALPAAFCRLAPTSACPTCRTRRWPARSTSPGPTTTSTGSGSTSSPSTRTSGRPRPGSTAPGPP